MLETVKTAEYAVCQKEMHQVLLSFLKQLTIITNIFGLSIVLTPYYFYVQASHKLGSLRKA